MYVRSFILSSKALLFAVAITSLTANSLRADILAAGFFSGTIDRYTAATGTFSTFATVATQSDFFPGVSGIVVNESANRVYATGYQSGRVYEIDATTGAVLNSVALGGGIAPGGIALDAVGNVYVSNQGGQDPLQAGNQVIVLNSSLSQVASFTLPDLGLGANRPAGLAFNGPNSLVVSTLSGFGVFTLNTTNGQFTNIATSSPVSNSQVAVDPTTGNVAIGGAFTNDISVYNPSLTSSTVTTIDSSVLPLPALPYASADLTFPSGVAYDPNGNLIIGALGRTNPFSGPMDLSMIGQMNGTDNFQSNGGLFAIPAGGGSIISYGVNTTPYSSVAYISAVPEPTTIAILSALTAVVGMRQWRVRRAARRVA